MKTIDIRYWKKDFSNVLPYKHSQTFEYSKEKILEIISTVIDKGLNVKTSDHEETFVIFIDQGRFVQS